MIFFGIFIFLTVCLKVSCFFFPCFRCISRIRFSYQLNSIAQLGPTNLFVRKHYCIFKLIAPTFLFRAAFMCGREPNFELSEEEKQELSKFKWEEFLAMTRHAITHKSNLSLPGSIIIYEEERKYINLLLDIFHLTSLNVCSH